jgi:hypothetical protein
MRYSNIKTSILEQFKVDKGNKVVPFILSAPGGGKSALIRDVAKTMFAERGMEMIQYDDSNPDTWETANYVEFNASLRDPVDLLGTPNNTGTATRWKAPGEFYALRRGTGFKFINFEELSDATQPMQNGVCSVVYDQRAGNTLLTEQLFICASGNRTEDKSGANRIVGKLANRTRRFEYQENVDDWTDWALDNNIDPVLIQFIRFRPALLSDYDANRFANPTPRSWERVNMIPASLDSGLFFDNCAGEVGEGAAAEYTGFRRIYMALPNIESILLDPAGADVPADPATLYALTGALARKSTKDNFDRVSKYLSRMSPEFNVMATKDAIKMCPQIKSTRAFVEWASKNAEVLM